jgi:predicted RNA-binding Zn ribbon-like protein
MHSSYSEFIKHGHGKTGPWFDLVNSEEWDTYGRRTDHFSNPAWLPFFLRRWNFAKPNRAKFPAANWKQLRVTLRRICKTAAQQKPFSAADIRALNHFLKVLGQMQLLQRQNALQLQFMPEVSGWNWILAETARSFADLLSRGDSLRIKTCRNPVCRWVFFDQTKGKTRCWCDDKICGNRERVRRARSRAKD